MSQDAYLRCRSFGHAWDDRSGTTNWKAMYLFGAQVTLRCIRCNTRRRDIWSTASGQLISRQYEYPDGYKDGATMGRSEWRKAYLTSRGYDENGKRRGQRNQVGSR